MSSEKTFPISILIVLTGIFYLTFISRMILAPLLPVIENDLGIGHGTAGSLFLFTAVGFGIGLLGSGAIAARFSHRRTILLSTILMGGAMLWLSRSSSVGEMYVGLLFAGMFGALYLPSGIATLTEVVDQRHWGKAIAIHELAPNVGFTTAPLVCEALLRLFEWRKALATLGVSLILVGLLFLLSGLGSRQKGESPGFKLLRQIVRDGAFWRTTAFFVTSVGLTTGVYAMLPLYLVNEGGMSREMANTFVSVSRVFGIIALFFAGTITDRVGFYRPMILFTSLGGMFTLLLGLIPGTKIITYVVILQAASVACLFPVAFVVVSTMFASKLRNVGVSLVALFGTVIGGGAIPTGLGYWAEAFSFSSAFILLGVLSLGVQLFFPKRTKH